MCVDVAVTNLVMKTFLFKRTVNCKKECPKCAAKGKFIHNIVEIPNKSNLVSSKPEMIYGTQYQCKRCGYEFNSDNPDDLRNKIICPACKKKIIHYYWEKIDLCPYCGEEI